MSWYGKVYNKVKNAERRYAELKTMSITSETLDEMANCQAIIGVYGQELRRLEREMN